MSAQLICKVIRILERLISIILMNLHGKSFFFFLPRVRKEKKNGIRGTSGKYGGGSRWGKLLWVSLTFGVTGVIQS